MYAAWQLYWPGTTQLKHSNGKQVLAHVFIEVLIECF